MKFLPLIWAGLKRKKLRTALTLLSILVAFILFGFLGALQEAFLGGVKLAGADRLIVRHKVSIIQTLPESYGNRIARIDGVLAVTHQTWFGGVYQDPKNFFATMPCVPETFLAMYPEFILKEEEKKAWAAKRNGAVVGRATADRFHWKLGDRVPIQSPIWGQPKGQSEWDFEIVGIYDGAKKGTDTTSFYFRYDYFEEARERGKGEVGWYVVKVKDPARAAEVAKRIDEEFANSPYETKAEPEGAFAQGFMQQVGDIAMIVNAVTAAVFFTILLVAGNTMAQSVRERTEELGVLKAIGFSNGRVLGFVLVESCVIAVLGGWGGLALAWALLLGGSPVPSMLPVLYVPQNHLLVGLGLALALGLVAGALPAAQAMRLRIAEALRRGG